MTSPGGQEVGRVSIRVVPETSRFRRDLQEQLRRETQGIEIEIPVDLDTAGLRSKLQAAARAASAGVDAEIGVDINRNVTSQVREVVDSVSNAVNRATSEISVNETAVKTSQEIQQSFGDTANSAASIRANVQRTLGPLAGISRSIRDASTDADGARLSVERLGQSAARTADHFKQLNGATGAAGQSRIRGVLDALRVPFEGLRRDSGAVADGVRGVADQARRFDGLKFDSLEDFRKHLEDLDTFAGTLALHNIRGQYKKYLKEVRKAEDQVRKELANAVQPTLQDLEKQAVVFKIDADLTVLRRKVTQAEKELDDLRRNGRDIVIDAQIEPLLNAARKVEAELDKLGNKRVTPEVTLKIDEKRAELAALEAQMERMAARDWTTEVEVQVDNARARLAALQLQLARLEINKTKHTVEIDIDRNTLLSRLNATLGPTATTVSQMLGGAFQGAFAALGSLFPRLVGGPLRAASSAFDSFGRSSQSAISNVSGAFVQVAASIALAVLQVGLLAGAVAIIGAAVTAAFGIIATAVSVLPGILVGAAAGFGVIYLGIDGIKRAAKTIEPVLDDLKAKVSATFEKGLTPQFKLIGQALKNLTPDIAGVADQFIVLGDTLTKTLTGGPGFDNIKAILSNIGGFVKDIGPGLKDLLEGFLKVGAQESVWTMLSTALNTFSSAFSASVDKMVGNGTFDKAVEGLSALFVSLNNAIVGLVENGLRLWVGASPGVTSFIDELTRFFGRFNWERLGGAVGAVFQGLGQVLRDVDDETIRAIEDAFVKLGEVFQDPEFQRGLGDFIKAIPDIVEFFTWLIDIAGKALTPISDLVKKLGEIKLFDFNEWLTGQKVGQGGVVQLGGVGVEGDGFDWTDPFKNWKIPDLEIPDFGIDTLGDDLNTSLKDGIDKLDKKIPLQFTTEGGLSLDQTFANIMMNARIAVASGFQIMATETIPGGMAVISTAIAEDVLVAQAWTDKVLAWEGIVLTALVNIGINTVPIGMQVIANGVLVGVNQISIMWDLAGAAWQASVLNSMNTIGLTVQNGMAQVSGFVQVGMNLVTAAFIVGWLSAVLATVNGVNQIVITVVTGIDRILTALAMIPLRLPLIFVQAWLGALQATLEGILGVVGAVAGAARRIVEAIPNPLSLLYNAGLSIAKGLGDGIKAGAQAVYEYVAGIAGRIAALKGPLPYDRRLLIPAGLAIMSGLDKGLRAGWLDVERTVGGFAGDIAATFGDSATGLIPDSVSSYVSGEVAASVASDDFGVDASGLAAAFASEIEGLTMKADGRQIAKVVNNRNLRNRRRG